jgi:hypothetical protein
MIKIKLTRTIKGKELIEEFKKKYETLEQLKKMFKIDNENME